MAIDADAHPSHPPRILQGQKIEDKADMGFRTALRELAACFQGAGGCAAFSRTRDAGRLSSEAEQAYREVLPRLRTAIGQPVRFAGNLFRSEKGNVILPGALWSELSIMGHRLHCPAVGRVRSAVRAPAGHDRRGESELTNKV